MEFFTASQARLKVYKEVLEPLQAFSIRKRENPGEFVTLGKFLGDLTNEFGKDKYHFDPEHFLEECFSGGPKNYRYKKSDGTTEFKCKGHNLKRADVKKQLGYEKLKRSFWVKREKFKLNQMQSVVTDILKWIPDLSAKSTVILLLNVKHWVLSKMLKATS